MNPLEKYIQLETRRQFFGRSAMGLGVPALASLLGGNRTAQATAALPPQIGQPGLPHHAPTAKRAIYLFMAGAPAQHDLLDHKPLLADMFDQDLPASVRKGQRLTTMTSGQSRLPIAPSKFKFSQYGQHGAWFSELMRHTGGVADDIAVIQSMHTEAINHDPAITYICTGDQLPGKASLGAWLSYGLGSENRNLPSFVVLNSTWSGRKSAQALYNRLWGTGFLPSKYQGVLLRSQGDPVLYLSDPKGVSPSARRRMLDHLGALNESLYEQVGDRETRARIAQYEMAFRMQSSVPELTDISNEPKHVLEMYGPEVHKAGTFARNCLLARRMMERDVRFVQVFHRGWDQHSTLPHDLPLQAGDIDQPSAALVRDLKQRGMLDDTLVVWGGEFGRTVYCQGTLTKDDYGRDHHPKCFSIWMAGGGIKPGIVYGKTDDFSYNIVENPVHIHELNATIQHCMGINPMRFSYPFQGLDQRLTGVEPAKAVRGLLA